MEQLALERSINGKKHRCIFLPKFHPELNPIERVWGRMKWYVRQYCDHKTTHAQLKETMIRALESTILPISLIRKYIRLSYAYLIAYKYGNDIVEATSWIK